MKHQYIGEYQIRSHEINQHKEASLPALIMLMQDASMQNAIEKNISVWDLEEKNWSWVLLRKEVNIYRYPYLNEKIKIRTYPAGFDRIFAYRDFLVFDIQDELIAAASSTWTLMDLKLRKLVRIPSEILYLTPELTEAVLPLPDSHMDSIKKPEGEYNYSIKYFDLDWNGHVNNTVFIRLMLQSMNTAWHDSFYISRFNFQIKAECYDEELLVIQAEFCSKKIIHQILKSDGTVTALGVSHFEQRKKK